MLHRRTRFLRCHTAWPLMPEGDTIHRTANRLRPVLVGKALLRFEAPRLVGERPRTGDVIEAVEAIGKHLIVRFPGRLVLQTHMRMTGSWHIYRAGERWQEPAHLARVTIAVPEWVAVCFAAPTVLTWRDLDGVANPLAHLGPDLCLPDVDFELVLERLRTIAEPGTPVAEVLLDQRIASGIGNVYKSEALWACGQSPFAPIEKVSDPDRDRLYRTASRQLRANLDTAMRTTIAGGLAVYDRVRRPCRRCGTTIEAVRHGDLARSTYWCPRCQGPGPAGGPPGKIAAIQPNHPAR